MTRQRHRRILSLALVGVLIVGAPHPEYRGLKTSVPVADIWNVLGNGVRV